MPERFNTKRPHPFDLETSMNFFEFMKGPESSILISEKDSSVSEPNFGDFWLAALGCSDKNIYLLFSERKNNQGTQRIIQIESPIAFIGSDFFADNIVFEMLLIRDSTEYVQRQLPDLSKQTPGISVDDMSGLLDRRKCVYFELDASHGFSAKALCTSVKAFEVRMV